MKKLPVPKIIPQKQAALFEIEAGWFHVFHDFVRSQMAEMTGSELKVYLAIRTHVNDRGDSFPGIDLIAQMSGISAIQVKRALKSLEESGYISKKKLGRHNVYQMFDQWPVVKTETKDEVNRFEIAPYIPALVNEITQQLKAALSQGNLPTNGNVNLNLNMPVTVNYAGQGGTVINNHNPETVNIKIENGEVALNDLPESLRGPMLAIRPKKTCG